MPAASDTTSESGYNVEHVHVYIDNAHLWMHEPRLYFTRDGCWEWNPLWRFDAGRLQAILEQESGLEITKSPYSFHYYLHGPAPPVDTIWGDPSCDVHPGQRPDFINAQITADSVTTAVSASFDETRNTFIIVSGDAGLSAAVTRIQKCGYPVHVWSWRSGLTAKHDEGTVQVHFLDDHFARLVSCDTTFCVDPTALSPSSLVVLDPLPHADKIQDCVAKLRAPVYQYAVADPRPKTSSQDLVITPAFQAHNWGADGSGDDLQATKMQLEGCGCAVLTYTEYVQQHCEDGRGKLVVSNQFKELPASLWHADYEDDGAEANGHDSAAWATVDYKKKKKGKQEKAGQQKPRKRCGWRGYCKNGIHCKYAHTKAEEDGFLAFGPKMMSKYRLCRYRYQDCYRGAQCFFAHSESELFCPTCEHVGHVMESCPERYV